MGFRVGKILAAVAAVALFGAFPAAQAQVPDPYGRELARQLAQAEALLGQRGYHRVAGPFAGGLDTRLNRRFQLNLRAGQEYRVIGVCDSRCSDIDMRIYDSADNVVAQDLLDDDVPIMELRPRVTGLYTIEVVMWQCTARPCFFAFNVYAR